MDTVRLWCTNNAIDYRFLYDELFDCLDSGLLDKLSRHRVIASDLARLKVLRAALDDGADAVVWLDADFLVFDQENFALPDAPYAVGREVWVQHDQRGKLKAYKKVHNAFLMFCQGNAFLDFYIETAERLLRKQEGGIPAQFIGPKLLTAIHNICQLPVMESAGMLSPLVIRDLLQGGGEALRMFHAKSPAPLAGANLCASSCDSGEVNGDEMGRLVDVLTDKQHLLQ